jgi:TPR repeat protein
MSFLIPPGRRAAAAVICALLTFASLPSAPAAERDSAPVLLSRTAGGASWSSVAELKDAAEKGNPKAQAYLGEIMLRGEGVPQNRRQAIELLDKAARAGEGSAAFRLAMVLDDGDEVEQDRPRAFGYFRAAAAGGVTEAFHNIGAAYAGGRGVKPSPTEALAWFILARKRGAESEAENLLRERLEAMRRSQWIAAAERRAEELEREIAQQKVADLLPEPAAINVIVEDAPPPPAEEPKGRRKRR